MREQGAPVRRKFDAGGTQRILHRPFRRGTNAHVLQDDGRQPNMYGFSRTLVTQQPDDAGLDHAGGDVRAERGQDGQRGQCDETVFESFIHGGKG